MVGCNPLHCFVIGNGDIEAPQMIEFVKLKAYLAYCQS